MPPHLEDQSRAVGVADVDLLPVLDIHDRHPASVDEHPVETAVVDGDPPALIEPQHQMRAGDQGMGDAHIGAEDAAHDLSLIHI